ncbi:MAG: peptidoglycan bridge formation glycyltransferase FemA/FemB family protein [Treponema sp.]|nr:peptidoglycan bridge formation glycyltransferase FemA/FemB family protein [Candidatus Treponema equifaecale]
MLNSKRFQQSDFWADFKCAHGWSKITETYNDSQKVNILVRTFRAGFVNASIAYVPLAPEYIPSSSVPGFEIQAQDEVNYIKSLGEFASQVKKSLPKNTLCLRFDIPLDIPTVEIRDDYVSRVPELASSAKVNIKKTSVDIQPPDSTFIDLTRSTDEIMAAMKNKWRYNVRYAAKHGVEVRAITANSPDFQKDLDSFYELYKTTAARDGIGLHPKSYYEDLLKRGALVSTSSTAANSGSTVANSGSTVATESNSTTNDSLVTLYIASHEGEDLAAIITLFQKDEAIYLYGCSGNNKRNLMPAYLVQWTAIQDAKNFGSKIYDFYGIPPTGDEGHPMHGLYLFKTGFGGPEVHRPGSFDIPLSWLYKPYTMAENFRAFWHKKVMKKIRGR